MNDTCRLRSELSVRDIHLEGSFSIGTGGRLPNYEGDYNIIPKVQAQELETKNKSMTDNLVIEEIPYSEVSNPSGGNTVNIAYIL